MAGCCAVGCRNSRKKGFKVYKLPGGVYDKARRNIWISKIRRKNFKPSQHTVLCEVHFDPDQFEKLLPGKLKPNAVPTLFSYLQSPKQTGSPILLDLRGNSERNVSNLGSSDSGASDPVYPEQEIKLETENELEADPYVNELEPDPCENELEPDPCENELEPDPCENELQPDPCENEIEPDPSENELEPDPCENELETSTVPMNDELLISFVKEHPFLYNNRLKDYKNKQKKEFTWNKIALTLGYDVSELKRRWKVLRDRFVRRLRTYDSDELYSKLPHYAQLSFLTNLVNHRTKQSANLEELDESLNLNSIFLHDRSSDEESVTYADTEPGKCMKSYRAQESITYVDTEPSKFKKSYSDEEEIIESFNVEELFLHSRSSDDVSDRYSESVNTEPPPKKRKTYSDVKFLSYSDISRRNLGKTQSASDDVHFLLSLRSSLSQISDDRKKICLKGEILNLVQDYLE